MRQRRACRMLLETSGRACFQSRMTLEKSGTRTWWPIFSPIRVIVWVFVFFLGDSMVSGVGVLDCWLSRPFCCCWFYSGQAADEVAAEKVGVVVDDDDDEEGNDEVRTIMIIFVFVFFCLYPSLFTFQPPGQAVVTGVFPSLSA